MPLFTKTLKLKAFTKNRFGKYLLYALGEVILVVLGILIALNINNRNEENNQKKLINGILKNVALDLKQDTIVINHAILYYEDRKKVSEDILNDKYDVEDFKKCGPCHTTVSHFFPVDFNDKGYNQLRNFYERSEQNDTLVTQTVQFYKQYTTITNDIRDQLRLNSMNTIENWRDSQPWFSDLIIGKPTEAYFEYTASQDFKNRIAHYYALAGQNYLGLLKLYKANAVVILKSIEARKNS